MASLASLASLVPSTFDPGTAVTDAINKVGDQLTSVSTPALALGGGVLALGVGWRFAKKFVKG